MASKISNNSFIGCNHDFEILTSVNDGLSYKVVEQVNDCQHLVLINEFARESSETQFKSKIEERVADIKSWRWVLEDLSKRLTDAATSLKREQKAVRVVVDRIQNEIAELSRVKMGALAPEVDRVEDAIQQEYEFLREQKKTFEGLIPELEKNTEYLEKTKKRLDIDISKKVEAITVEVSCANIDLKSLEDKKPERRNKKRTSPINRWENRCAALKRAGLRSLEAALIVRQRVRGARVQLSIAAQSYSSQVDVALRKRLHHNTFKLKELEWQKEEMINDVQSLQQEQLSTEQSLVTNMEYERVIEARLADRALRPRGEQTKDDVDKKLKDEIVRLRLFIRSLRANLQRVSALQNKLCANIEQIDCYAQDLIEVVRLDQDRLSARCGEEIYNSSPVPEIPTYHTLNPTSPEILRSPVISVSLPPGAIGGDVTLNVTRENLNSKENTPRMPILLPIREENEDVRVEEEDNIDYPFDY